MLPQRDSLTSRILSAALSLALVVGGVPAQAWAEAAGEVGVQQVAAGQDGSQGDGSGGSDATGDQGADDSASSGSKSGTSSSEDKKPDVADNSEQKSTSEESTSDANGSGSDLGDTSSAKTSINSYDDDGWGDYGDDEGEGDDTGSSDTSDSTSEAATLSSSTSVKLQASADEDYYSSVGSISVGDTLWANAFNGSGYSYTAVSNPAWSYQWMSGDSDSDSASDYTAIPGATSRSYTVGEGQKGKYLICKVTGDGVTRYAPSGYWGDVSTDATHGPVLGKGQVKLYEVKLDKTSPSVGDTITATPYTSYSTKAPNDAAITYQWSMSDSKNGTFTDIEGATSATLQVTDAYQGKYLKVTATSGNSKDVTTSDAVLGKGAVKLSGVMLEGKPSGKIDQGTTLTAQAYTGYSYSPTYVTEGVTYTWRYSESDPSGYGTITWTTISGATGPTLKLDKDEYLGKYISVQASAGANTVSLSDYSCPGPVRAQGQVDIYTAFVSTSQDSTSSTYLYNADNTLWAWAKEKDASDTVDPDKLTYQWQWSDSKGSGYQDIKGATGQSLSLADYAGKYVRCHVASKVGSSSRDTTARNKVAASNAITISSVSLASGGTALSSGDKVGPGDTLVATATTADGTDVTANDKVTWQWYQADSSYAAGTKIDGATSATYEPTESQVGSHIYAVANGGAQDATSPRVQVKKAGAVTLYRVVVSGTATVGETLAATAYVDSATEADSKATVSYVWQYSDTKSTNDYDFTTIEGATGSTLKLTDDLVGKYIRVVATSDNTVKSTSRPYDGSTTSVDPVGPVTLPGGYQLSTVEVASSEPNVQVGATLTPKAQVSVTTSWGAYDDDVPGDAKLTYVWHAADADGSNEATLGEADGVASDGSLTVPAALEGKRVWVTASALMNIVTSGKESVAAHGAYDLKSVLVTPTASTQLKTADTVSARVYANNLAGTGTKVTGREGVSLQWYVADAQDVPDDQWEALDGATSATLVVPPAADGRYLKVVATSAGTTASTTFEEPVAKANTPQGAVAALSSADISDWRPKPVYADAATHNINDLLLAELASQGVDTTGMTVTAQVDFGKADTAATVGVASDGAVTFFACDPDQLTPDSDFLGAYMDALRSGDATYTISKEGEQDATYQTRLVVPWDEDAAQALLQAKADQLAIGYAEGDSAGSVTQDVTLPYKAGSPASVWTSVTWTSTDAALEVSGNGISDYAGKVSLGEADQSAQVTATVTGLANYGLPEGVSVTKTFALTVKADPEKVAEQERQALQAKLDAKFTYENVKNFSDKSAISADGTNVADDLQLPTPGTLGVDGNVHTGTPVTYTSDSPLVTIDAYHAKVVRPVDGKAQTVHITCTATSALNPEIRASKTLTFTIAPLSDSELDAEVALMGEAEEGYKEALLGGQTEPVTKDLTTFLEAYRAADGSLVWTGNRDQANAQAGIVACELDGYDSMRGNDQARTFRPGDTSLLENEDLKLAWNVDPSDYLGRYHAQPKYNTKVTVTSKLASERYGAYYAQYKDDPTVPAEIKTKLLKLAPYNVSATVNVAGTTGQEAPIPQVKVTASVIGMDASGEAEYWATPHTYTVDEGSSATEVFKNLTSDAGLAVGSHIDPQYGYSLDTITSPDTGDALGWNSTTGKYWQFFVGDDPAQTGPDGVSLKNGDILTWYYSKWGDKLATPVERVRNVSVSIIGTSATGAAQTWATASGLSLKKGAKASDVVKALLKDHPELTADVDDEDGTYWLNSITNANGTLANDPEAPDPGKPYWQFYVNGAHSKFLIGQYELNDDDAITLAYNCEGDPVPSTDQPTPVEQLSATVKVSLGQGGSDKTLLDTMSLKADQGVSVAEASAKALAAAGLSSNGAITTVTKDGATYTNEEGAPDYGKKYWHLFVNGEKVALGTERALKDGDAIEWRYYADQKNVVNGVTIYPDEPLSVGPDAIWGGYRGTDATGVISTQSGLISALTPTEGGKLEWEKQFSTDMTKGEYLSEPIVVGGNVYVAVSGAKEGNKLEEIDSATGKVVRTCDLIAPIDSISRMVYVKDQGLIIVPLTSGRLQAVNLKTFHPVWPFPETGEALNESYQSLSTPLVEGGVIYFAATQPNDSGSSTLVAVDVKSGKKLWSQENTGAGYYWSGAASTPAGLVIGDGLGRLALVDKASGKVIDRLSLSSEPIRSTVVADGAITYAVSKDGWLHKVSATGGKLFEVGKVRFASYSTSTPTLNDGKIYVAGYGKVDASGKEASDENKSAVLAVIDTNKMTVERSVTSLKKDVAITGESKSSPLVVKHGNEIYVYFTTNAEDGGAYVYKVGDDYAALLTDKALQGYTMASLVVGDDGGLYFVNDTGALFKLKPGPAVPQTKPGQKEDPGKKTGEDPASKEKSTDSSGADNTDGGGTTSTKPTGGLKSNLATASGTATNSTDQASGTPLGLLAGMGSDGSAVAEDGVAYTTGVAESANTDGTTVTNGLPIWPIVGMALGLVALVLALVAYRGKGRE